MSEDDLHRVLTAIDESQQPIAEHEIQTRISALKPKDGTTWTPSPEYLAENMAFGFRERRNDEEEENGPCEWFHPLYAGRNEDGTAWEWPSVHLLNDKVIHHWAARAEQSHHPVMRARYAGLVWEFSPSVLKKRASIKMATVRVEAAVEMTTRDWHEHPIEVWPKLAHALHISISISNPSLIERVRDAIIAFEKKVGDDDKPGLWGRAFDLLCSNNKATLSESQRDAMIADLEERLERISDPQSTASKLDPWAAEAAAQRLAVHYRKKGSRDDLRRVLSKVERAFNHLIEQADPMVAQAWCEQVERLYRYFNLADDASRMRQRIQSLGPAAHQQMIPLKQEIKVSKEQMSSHVDAVLQGDLDNALNRFVIAYIPSRNETEKQLRDLANNSIVYLFNRKIVDAKGRPVASLGSLEEDMDGHVIAHTAQFNIGLRAIFLRNVIAELIRRYSVTTATVLGWFDRSPIFDSARNPLFERGLNAYFADDSVLTLHLLVPQVENVIRRLVELAGGDVFHPNRQGGMDLRTFDDLLRDPIAVEVLTPGITEYFRILYTDRRGINLRNNLCHGMMEHKELANGLADRVFHTLVLLAVMVREANEEH